MRRLYVSMAAVLLASTLLAETSCSYFNLNLGRSFLFGGRDPQLGELPVGFFVPSLEDKGDVESA